MTPEALEIIALSELAGGLSRNAAGMEGFAAHYEKSLKPADRAIVEKYRTAKAKASAKLSGMWDDFEKNEKLKTA